MNATGSAVHTIYSRLSAAGIGKMVGTVQENHLVDFKLAAEPSLSSKDDKKVLACAISAFANADGGVIIWGVDARRDPKEDWIDQVVAAPGVHESKRLLSRLIELTAQACNPAPLGIEHKVLTARGGPSFVVTLVPPSDGGPHMAMLGERRYYTRSGGSSLPMEHHQIADMFGRRPVPLLVATAEKYNPYEFRFRVTNRGRGPARAPFLLFYPPPPFQRNQYGVDGNRNEHLPYLHASGQDGILHAAGADFVIHPTMSVVVGGITVGFTQSPEMLERARGVSEVRYRVGALGVQPMDGVLTIDPG